MGFWWRAPDDDLWSPESKAQHKSRNTMNIWWQCSALQSRSGRNPACWSWTLIPRTDVVRCSNIDPKTLETIGVNLILWYSRKSLFFHDIDRTQFCSQSFHPIKPASGCWLNIKAINHVGFARSTRMTQVNSRALSKSCVAAVIIRETGTGLDREPLILISDLGQPWNSLSRKTLHLSDYKYSFLFLQISSISAIPNFQALHWFDRVILKCVWLPVRNRTVPRHIRYNLNWITSASSFQRLFLWSET